MSVTSRAAVLSCFSGPTTSRRTSVATGFENLEQLTIEIDARSGGHLYLAHRLEKMETLRKLGQLRSEGFGYKALLLRVDEIHRAYCDEREQRGALLEEESMGVRPLKFPFDLLCKARAGRENPPGQPGAGLDHRPRRAPVATPAKRCSHGPQEVRAADCPRGRSVVEPVWLNDDTGPSRDPCSSSGRRTGCRHPPCLNEPYHAIQAFQRHAVGHDPGAAFDVGAHVVDGADFAGARWRVAIRKSLVAAPWLRSPAFSAAIGNPVVTGFTDN